MPPRSLRARVDRLAVRLEPSPGWPKVVEVVVEAGEPIEWEGNGVVLRVPPAAGGDPMSALTGDQRTLIGPADKVVILVAPPRHRPRP